VKEKQRKSLTLRLGGGKRIEWNGNNNNNNNNNILRIFSHFPYLEV
jgi:hypothetical protein